MTLIPDSFNKPLDKYARYGYIVGTGWLCMS